MRREDWRASGKDAFQPSWSSLGSNHVKAAHDLVREPAFQVRGLFGSGVGSRHQCPGLAWVCSERDVETSNEVAARDGERQLFARPELRETRRELAGRHRDVIDRQNLI